MKIKTCFIFYVFLLLAGCSVQNNIGDNGTGYSWLEPTPLATLSMPNKDSGYTFGFMQGCYDKMGIYKPEIMEAFATDKNLDPTKMINQLFLSGYERGYSFCGDYGYYES